MATKHRWTVRLEWYDKKNKVKKFKVSKSPSQIIKYKGMYFRSYTIRDGEFIYVHTKLQEFS